MSREEKDRREHEELDLLRRIERDEREDIRLDKEILARLKPRLSFIKIRFGSKPMQGPVTLQQGQSTVATLLYFDQLGNPMPPEFVPPAVSFTIDHPEIASSTPRNDLQTDDVAFVTPGVANLTASVTSAEGLALTDTETITDSPIVAPPPVLSSVKIDFSTPVSGAAAGRATKK